jgi:hypothetical protein
MAVRLPVGGTEADGRLKVKTPVGLALVMVTTEPGGGAAPVAVGVKVLPAVGEGTRGQRRVSGQRDGAHQRKTESWYRS